MIGRIVGVVVVGLLTACSTPLPIVVESSQYPDVAIECGGEPGLTAHECLAWAEQMLPAAPTRPAGAEQLEVANLVLTYRTGNSRCAADYFTADGRLVMTASAVCPSR